MLSRIGAVLAADGRVFDFGDRPGAGGRYQDTDVLEFATDPRGGGAGL